LSKINAIPPPLMGGGQGEGGFKDYATPSPIKGREQRQVLLDPLF
jgi:hypothetical protein